MFVTLIETCGGSHYFVIFINDFSKYCHFCILKIKDEVFDKFKIFKAEVKNQIEKKIKILRFDRQEEYTSNEFAIF